MADQLVEMTSENSDPIVPNLDADKPFSVSEPESVQGGITNSLEGNSASSGILDNYSDNEPTQTLPILQKIIDLSTKIKNLKDEHAMLSTQVKGIATESFPAPDALNTLKLLGSEYELLKKKYLEEFSERKRLYNEVIELKGNIRVFCRCRPLNQVEITNGSASIVEFDSSHDNELQIISSDSSKKQFKFDHVFKPEDNQEAVFAETKPIVTSVLDGFNVCIFAYGQTGTGKTFTMEGTPEKRGVNYRTLEELFRISDERHGVMRYELLVSMLEVYNEKIRDLLVDNPNQASKKLEIKQGAEGTQEVPGLIEAPVHGTEQVWELLKSGNKARSVGSTSANELSSRSHCLLRVTVKGENLINGSRTRSHLWLVDLAGSERVGRIDVEGERLKESQFINKSLSALGDVISALACKTTHIPYRNSKLTHILQSSLGGDCKTLMFVQISPSGADLGETVCSLNFASRVRGIESGPARKQTDVSELLKYKQMVEKLKHDDKETKKLQDTVQSLQLRLGAREHICRNLQEKVRDLENQLAEERKTRLKQEARSFAAQSSGLPPVRPAAAKKMTIAEKKPPLCPPKARQPLRRISNLMPQPATFPPRKSSVPSAMDKENNQRRVAAAAANTKCPARRISIAVPLSSSSSSSQNVWQPRRRVSIATTFRPEASTPSRGNENTFSQFGGEGVARNPRKARYSRLFTPLPELSTAAEMTPAAATRFMGSPPTQQQQGSWKPKHPTVIALQKKPLVWSPLKARGMMLPRRNSLVLPSCSQMQ